MGTRLSSTTPMLSGCCRALVGGALTTHWLMLAFLRFIFLGSRAPCRARVGVQQLRGLAEKKWHAERTRKKWPPSI